MKTLLECLLLAAFVGCVALATLTKQPMPILAAGVAAALLIGYADESAPLRRYKPGARKPAAVSDEMKSVVRQMHLWQWYLLLCIIAMIISATFLLFLINNGNWPGGLVTIPFVGAVSQGVALGIVTAGLMLYCLVISAGCIQPLEAVLERLCTEHDACVHAENARKATAGKPDWRADNQLDWDCPLAQGRLAEERRRRLFGD